MNTGETGGYRIGFKELYELVITVSAKLDTVTSQQATQIQANTSRIEGMGKGMQMMWEQFEKYKNEVKEDYAELERRIDARQGNNWQVNLAIASGFLGLLVSIGQMLIK